MDNDITKITSRCLSKETENLYKSHSENKITVFHSMFNLKWLGELEINPKVIFDIGCNNGGDSIRFKQTWPDAKVVGFEANSEFSDEFYKYINEDIIFELVGVSDVDGEELFYPGIWFDNSKSTAPWGTFNKKWSEKYKWGNGVMTKTISLYSYCQEHDIKEIDLLHVDAEGDEFKIIKGLKDLKPKLIFTEQNDKILSKRQINEFKKYMSKHYHLEIFCSMNYLYIRNDIKEESK